ncbi:hypothetical protein D9611_008361 [Ephemerocybe angulata]|uniref:Uncharacterized protein n=1 Tax=Ephemerocybe angulata TaxID=980116 RepID=A0A8H5BJ55_9AGAR|nr:hypothetical protein D9611_008361 [Tulosesus angulatus]
MAPPTTIVSTIHPYRYPTRTHSVVRAESLLQNTEGIVSVLHTLHSCWTRSHRIGTCKTVVLDDAHFGKFGSLDLKRELCSDVHPSLAVWTMLASLAGLMTG